MKILLHIGTHKTGTSSIQNFCARNQIFLAEHGFYYGLRGDLSARNVNFLGAWLANEKHNLVQGFLDNVIRKAEQANLSQVLLSGESFFAMTTHFSKSETISESEYWILEQKRIESLAKMLNTHETEIVCYLRRQDQFAESLYNQMVKQASGFQGDFEMFLRRISFSLDYFRHIDVWSNCFKNSLIQIRSFHQSPDVVTDFVNHALRIDILPSGYSASSRVNINLSQDLLEFKRELNTKKMSPAEELMAYRAVLVIAKVMGGGNSRLLTHSRRKELLKHHAPGNESLIKLWHAGKSIFPEISAQDSDERPYAGLMPAKRNEIGEMYAKLMRKPSVRIEIALRTFFRWADKTLWIGKYLVRPIRAFTYRRHLDREIIDT